MMTQGQRETARFNANELMKVCSGVDGGTTAFSVTSMAAVLKAWLRTLDDLDAMHARSHLTLLNRLEGRTNETNPIESLTLDPVSDDPGSI